MSYIALIAGLPDIIFNDSKLLLRVDEFQQQLNDYISDDDRKDVDMFFLPNDNAYIIQLLKKQSPNAQLPTVYPVATLENALQNGDDSLPVYINEFLSDYKNDALRYNVLPENVLSWMYYDYMFTSKNAFVRNFAEFSMNVKNLNAALNARKYGFNIEREIIGNNDFAQALRTSTAKDFGLSLEFRYVEELVSLFANDNIIEREKGIDLMFWNYLEDATVFEYFSLERVLAFMLRLMIVERWSKLDSESGKRVFMELVSKLQESVKI